MTFEDLKFSLAPTGNEQARVFFPNGYGASVIRGPYTYGGSSGLFELAVLKGSAEDWDLTYSTPITDDVLGYLNPSDVAKALQDIEGLK